MKISLIKSKSLRNKIEVQSECVGFLVHFQLLLCYFLLLYSDPIPREWRKSSYFSLTYFFSNLICLNRQKQEKKKKLSFPSFHFCCYIIREKVDLQGIMFLCLSLQQKQDTPQAMKIIKPTDTQPTMRSNFKLIWQFLPANHFRHSHCTSPAPTMTHSPLRLQRSHSEAVAEHSLPVRSPDEMSWYPSLHSHWYDPNGHIN